MVIKDSEHRAEVKHFDVATACYAVQFLGPAGYEVHAVSADQLRRLQPAEAAVEDGSLDFHEGEQVVIDGLRQATELNEQLASVECYMAETGRYAVRLARSNEIRRIKPQHLRSAADKIIIQRNVAQFGENDHVIVEGQLATVELFDVETGCYAVRFMQSGETQAIEPQLLRSFTAAPLLAFAESDEVRILLMAVSLKHCLSCDREALGEVLQQLPKHIREPYVDRMAAECRRAIAEEEVGGGDTMQPKRRYLD
eukprot:gnl/TRDRNA2_/TRDRNA2_150384_c0_seq1.p1 gnl/TRDRNA2_/TRDRNA2_150384_c0~~gnl/TRDRNA2_/TRDRNA2_150384_c0_seq1.p1  ORF type:complete len:268 (-),score=63.42 gnl/TRDRNA2_/TRDRNA2_150384_c0_seq1:29-790(-)